MISVTPEQVRAARALIYRKGLKSSDVPPKDLALLSERTGKTLMEALRILAALKMGGQGGSQFEQTKDTLIRMGEMK